MKHEKFKVFTLTNSKLTDGSLDHILKGKFSLRSISLAPLPKEDEAIVTIGYTDDKVEHEYHIAQVSLGHYSMTNHNIAQKITSAAESIHGVICHDISVINSQLVVTFLTTK